ncbi:MFS transporter [Microbacterium sp. zg.Y625]|uniref:MFS transporter n=1 Tax=Microbacterium jiangjiandongii TaxID=3049071 RepID=UPI00214BA9E6|nr:MULTISPECIES: MFS transporter [unclassified Microbacterium]MCR2794205.1 MFS transporter [Microbacterium sp. zg.Y625]MCR2816232.1 MFS transporter [Microbacterium sp. zg.Y843]WIM25501.1 MFS transporter [Microbacterium sp. zg-Y625]
MEAQLTRTQLVRWRAAIFAIFTASGLSIATWASRVPAIRSDLGIENSDIGLMLLGMGVASILGLSASGVIIARFGTRQGMLGAMIVFAIGVALIGVGTNLASSVPLVVIGLALFGFGNGSVDVMMNVEGAAIETQSGKTLLPLFHAFFSLGTVFGAGLGAVTAGLGVDVFTHTVIVAVVILIVAVVAYANVPPREGAGDPAADAADAADAPGWRQRLAVSLAAWREPRTYALGVVMLGMAFAEGGANDWLALGVSEDHSGGPALGAAALMVFSVAMTVVRVLGGPLVDRFGRVATLRVLSGFAAAGILLFILAPNLPLVFVGAALWGVGASLGFPLGMSAAADDPAKAASRVSAAATIGYVAFLCGPPVLGFISDHIGLLNTLYVLVVLVVASGFASQSARPLAGAKVGAGHHPDHG